MVIYCLRPEQWESLGRRQPLRRSRIASVLRTTTVQTSASSPQASLSAREVERTDRRRPGSLELLQPRRSGRQRLRTAAQPSSDGSRRGAVEPSREAPGLPRRDGPAPP